VAKLAPSTPGWMWYDFAMKKDTSKRIRRSAKTGKFTIGPERFAKISAVEGIVLTKQMRSRVSKFERKGASAEERRRIIIEAYRKN
jgi:hypothetical protein